MENELLNVLPKSWHARKKPATAALTKLKPVWSDRSISLSSKILVMRSLVTSSFCMLVNHGPSQQSSKEEYKPRKWGATATYHASHIKTMLPTKKSVPRSSSNRTTRRPPGHRKETHAAVVWTCLSFIKSGQNHRARHSERGKKTRQTKKSWEDNIREWTGLELGKSQRAMENREKWRKLVAKSSVVPQRPSRLRDWWWWWWWEVDFFFHLKLRHSGP